MYYAWFKHGGKQYHHSLRTMDKKHAPRLLRDFRNSVENVTSHDAGRVTFLTIADAGLTVSA